MAIARSALITAISGKVGGVEFAAAGGQMIVKRLKTRKPRQTAALIAGRQVMADSMRVWQGLTAEQRQAWGDVTGMRMRADRLGVVRALTPLQLFLTVPRDSRNLVTPPVQDIPPVNTVAGIYGQGCSISLSTGFWTSSYGWWESKDAYESLWISRFRGPAADGRAYRYRKIATILKDDGGMEWDTYLSGKGIQLLLGERVSARCQFWCVGEWPVMYDYGTIEVVA